MSDASQDFWLSIWCDANKMLDNVVDKKVKLKIATRWHQSWPASLLVSLSREDINRSSMSQTSMRLGKKLNNNYYLHSHDEGKRKENEKIKAKIDMVMVLGIHTAAGMKRCSCDETKNENFECCPSDPGKMVTHDQFDLSLRSCRCMMAATVAGVGGVLKQPSRYGHMGWFQGCSQLIDRICDRSLEVSREQIRRAWVRGYENVSVLYSEVTFASLCRIFWRCRLLRKPSDEERPACRRHRSSGGRVVKAIDSKSIGLCPHRFESCSLREVEHFFCRNIYFPPSDQCTHGRRGLVMTRSAARGPQKKMHVGCSAGFFLASAAACVHFFCGPRAAERVITRPRRLCAPLELLFQFLFSLSFSASFGSHDFPSCAGLALTSKMRYFFLMGHRSQKFEEAPQINEQNSSHSELSSSPWKRTNVSTLGFRLHSESQSGAEKTQWSLNWCDFCDLRRSPPPAPRQNEFCSFHRASVNVSPFDNPLQVHSPFELCVIDKLTFRRLAPSEKAARLGSKFHRGFEETGMTSLWPNSTVL